MARGTTQDQSAITRNRQLNVLPEGVYCCFKNYIVYYNIYIGVLIEMHVYMKFHLDPYHMPCFFYKNYNVYNVVYMLTSSELWYLSLHLVSFAYSFWFVRQLNVLPEGVYCCFTRTTLFITMFYIIDMHVYTKFHLDWPVIVSG